MKQKLFLLMVLMVGLVACSKDEDDSDNLQIDIYKSDNLNNLGMGEFVGDWILNNKKIESLRPLLNKVWSPSVFSDLTADTTFFKLTWKHNFKKTVSGHETVYGHLVKDIVN